MKNKLIFIILSILVCFAACKPPLQGSTEPRETRVLLAYNFLGTNFHDHHTQGLKNLNVVISVDRYAGNGVIETNYWTESRTMTNNDDSYSNREFTGIQVPATGSYAVAVTIISNECFDYASSAFCNWSKGRIMYRGNSVIINSANGIPSVIDVNPVFVSSF